MSEQTTLQPPPEGFLEVGHNDKGEVVVNLPHDMTGHIVFSPGQAISLSQLLLKRALLLNEAQGVQVQFYQAVYDDETLEPERKVDLLQMCCDHMSGLIDELTKACTYTLENLEYQFEHKEEATVEPHSGITEILRAVIKKVGGQS